MLLLSLRLKLEGKAQRINIEWNNAIYANNANFGFKTKS